MRLAYILALMALAAPAWADDDACSKFKWSVAREKALFAAPQGAGATDALSIGDKGFRVALADGATFKFPIAPERPPKPGTHAAALSLTIAKASVYQVTLSDAGWIDAVQSGVVIRSSGFSEQKACASVRKSVRFDLVAGAAILQLSNIEAPTADIAVVPTF